ncbi:hypothetical protein T484DRAFT_1956671, partial [Baffinella frigidus]
MSGYTNTASMQGEYEAATKHFLLIGFLAMLIGSIVFGSFVIKKTDNKMQEVLMFLVATISAASYYLMWSGYGVYKKTGSDGEERVVFVAELAQRMITEPLLIYSFALVTNAESGDVVLAMGTAALMSFASEIGVDAGRRALDRAGAPDVRALRARQGGGRVPRRRDPDPAALAAVAVLRIPGALGPRRGGSRGVPDLVRGGLRVHCR